MSPPCPYATGGCYLASRSSAARFFFDARFNTALTSSVVSWPARCLAVSRAISASSESARPTSSGRSSHSSALCVIRPLCHPAVLVSATLLSPMGNSYSPDPEDCLTDVSQVHQKVPLTWCRRGDLNIDGGRVAQCCKCSQSPTEQAIWPSSAMLNASMC